MRNLKKFLALVLVFMMAMSLMVTANAATTSNVEFTDSNDVHEAFEEDLVVVNGMGVIKGFEDGTFKPNATITRAQMAAIVYRMATGDVEDKYATNYVGYVGRFTDKNLDPNTGAYAWASGYIGFCANAEYIVGYPDGTFHPEKEVTGYQALAMILRAMGYNHPGNNFTGDDWATRTSEIADRRGMLVNIDKTSFGSALRVAAPRQVVAEMAFQGLTKAQVQWTNSYGYQTTGMDGYPGSGAQNPSLGYAKFGLTNHKGIVVGNQYTGETVTKIGFSLDTSITQGIQIEDNQGAWEVVGTDMSASINDNIDKEAYYYLTSNKANSTDKTAEKNVTLSFKWDSDLSLFNHAVDVWYDYRGTSTQTVQHTSGQVNAKTVSVNFRDNLNTYAVFDRATEHKVVKAVTDADTKLGLADTAAGTLGNAIAGAGMKAGANAFFNYAFARNAAANYVAELDGTEAFSGFSPIIANNGEDTYAKVVADTQAATDVHPLYLVISNSADKTADVVITLDMTLSKVVQDNNTQAPLSTGILTENDSVGNTTDYRYFDTWDQVSPAVGEDYSNVANKNRVDSYDAKLNDYVSAVAITGTTGTKTGVTTGAATATDGNATAAGAAPTGAAAALNMTSTYYYQMTKLVKTVTGTMVKFDQDTDTIHLNVGGEVKVYPRSIFALAVDGSFQSGAHVWAPRAAGEYTFYLDANDNWMFWEQKPNTGTFVYGTYIDWQTQLASSEFRYPLVYTNAAGDKALTNDITTIDGTSMSITNYASIMLPKRDNVTGSNSGFVPGQYIGYEMNGSALTTVTTTAGPSGFMQAGTGTGDFGEPGQTTTIDAKSVAIGAHPVTDATAAGGARLFLTERTKFIIVNGAGTANQSVTVYNGLAELLGTHSSVKIDATTNPMASSAFLNNVGANPANPGDNYAGFDAPYEMVYYSTEEDPYAQNYDQMDKHIDTVFIPAPLVSTTDSVSGNLFFVGDNTYGLIDAPNNATQYTFYQNGEKSVRWITGLPAGVKADGSATDAKIVTDLSDNVFYYLHDTGAKAVDGGAIYELIPFASQAAANAVIIGKYYGTDDVNGGNEKNTAGQTKVDGTTAGKGYLATTRNSQVAYIGGRTADDLFNISNANVLNLDDSFTINSIGDLNDQSSLTSNQGVDVSCVLGEKPITFIYVNFQ